MHSIILESREMINETQTHQILKEKLDLPDYYGENLNALWDCLTGWISLPLTIVWNDFEDSKKQLGSFADELLQLFQEAKDELEGFEIKVK